MKNVSRNKFMLCFRPVVDNMDLVLDHPNSSKHQQLYLGVDQKPSPADSPRPRRKSFSQAVKAVVFETILAKRVHEKKASSVRSFDQHSNTSRKRSAGGQSLNSDSTPPSSCSSSSFPTQELVLKQATEPENGKIREESEPKLNSERRARDDRGSGVDSAAVQLVLVSLTLTVLCGRVCAILFTLIWLYLVRRRQVVRAEEGERKRLVAVKRKWSSSAKSCREKVIMEGLLDRTNRRGSIQFLT